MHSMPIGPTGAAIEKPMMIPLSRRPISTYSPYDYCGAIDGGMVLQFIRYELWGGGWSGVASGYVSNSEYKA